MLEKQVEQALTSAVKARGGLALKFVSPGKHMRPLQEFRKRQLESLGFHVCCIDQPDQIPALLEEVMHHGVHPT